MSTAPAQSFETSDHLYRTVAGEALHGTLFRPLGAASPTPLVLEVHGGAWVGNDRHVNSAIHRDFAAHGIAVFAVDFRLPPTHPYPSALFDIDYAIRWLKEHAVEFGSRPALVGGIGTSSGGHLLTLQQLRSGGTQYRDAGDGLAERDACLAFAMACWPVLDPLARYHYALAAGRDSLITAHHAFWRDEAQMAEGNPLQILKRGEPARQPPLLLIQGTADNNFDYRNTVDFAAQYKATGGEVELELYEGEPHGFIREGRNSSASGPALARLREFILRRMGTTKARHV